MAIHPDGSGTGWTNVETVDVNQPHGKDYLYSQHIAKGVRKRVNQEHSAFADATVGGIHKPGGCAVLGVEDGTATILADGTLKGHGIVWDSSGILWCSTATAGASTTGNWRVVKLHPDLQWEGGDVTWAGEHDFNAPVCFSAVDISHSLDLTGALACGSTATITNLLTCSSKAKFVNDVSCNAGIIVDGTAIFGGDVTFGGNAVDGTAMMVHAQDAYRIVDVAGTNQVVYTKYLTGTLDANANESIAHGVATGLTKILSVTVHVYNDNASYLAYWITDVRIGASADISYQVTYDATNIKFIAKGANIVSNNYRIKIDYIL